MAFKSSAEEGRFKHTQTAKAGKERRMKVRLRTIAVMAILLALVISMSVFAVPVAAKKNKKNLTVELIAGQYIDVGEVHVWNTSTTLYVQYVSNTNGWKLTEVHLQVERYWTDIPQAEGNPIPGLFEYAVDPLHERSAR